MRWGVRKIARRSKFLGLPALYRFNESLRKSNLARLACYDWTARRVGKDRWHDPVEDGELEVYSISVVFDIDRPPHAQMLNPFLIPIAQVWIGDEAQLRPELLYGDLGVDEHSAVPAGTHHLGMVCRELQGNVDELTAES